MTCTNICWFLSRCIQMQWEKRIHKSLNSMCNEIGVPLARFRLASDRDELEEKWTELSTYDIGEPQAEINKCVL